ncbi:unnamed protein product, partial [Iphiclides podalirius]
MFKSCGAWLCLGYLALPGPGRGGPLPCPARHALPRNADTRPCRVPIAAAPMQCCAPHMMYSDNVRNPSCSPLVVRRARGVRHNEVGDKVTYFDQLHGKMHSMVLLDAFSRQSDRRGERREAGAVALLRDVPCAAARDLRRCHL